MALQLLFQTGVRPFFLAWLTIALLLFALGRLSHAGDEMSIFGFVTATEQEAGDGYFPVGADAMLVIKPGTGLHRWMRLHGGQHVRVTVETAGLEK
jgi:hypothetical protein